MGAGDSPEARRREDLTQVRKGVKTYVHRNDKFALTCPPDGPNILTVEALPATAVTPKTVSNDSFVH